MYRGPTVNDIFPRLTNACCLTFIDTRSGYHNLKLEKGHHVKQCLHANLTDLTCFCYPATCDCDCLPLIQVGTGIGIRYTESKFGKGNIISIHMRDNMDKGKYCSKTVVYSPVQDVILICTSMNGLLGNIHP